MGGRFGQGHKISHDVKEVELEVAPLLQQMFGEELANVFHEWYDYHSRFESKCSSSSSSSSSSNNNNNNKCSFFHHQRLEAFLSIPSLKQISATIRLVVLDLPAWTCLGWLLDSWSCLAVTDVDVVPSAAVAPPAHVTRTRRGSRLPLRLASVPWPAKLRAIAATTAVHAHQAPTPRMEEKIMNCSSLL